MPDLTPAEIDAGAEALHADQCPEDPADDEACTCGHYRREAEVVLGAVLPDHNAALAERIAQAIAAEAAGWRIGPCDCGEVNARELIQELAAIAGAVWLVTRPTAAERRAKRIATAEQEREHIRSEARRLGLPLLEDYDG